MLLEEYRPHPALVTRFTQVLRPRFPVVDAHNHLALGSSWADRPVTDLVRAMDEAGVRVFVDLDGGWGEEILDHRLGKYKQAIPERYLAFAGVNWARWAEEGNHFPDWAAARLREQARRGAQGLKIWKPFGLTVKDHRDERVPVDDPRLDVLWETAGELDLPVTIHVADPVAFFDPLDSHNERYEELSQHPDWHFPSPPFPPFMQIMNELANLIMRHPRTTFITAHVGCYAENLGWVGALLDRCPNLYTDISARAAELGRQPYAARRFFLRYADRILFGTDAGPDVDEYRRYYRFLESDDEYFPYGGGEVPGQGRWNIYGLFLPDNVLEKVYYQNAARVLKLAQLA